MVGFPEMVASRLFVLPATTAKDPPGVSAGVLSATDGVLISTTI